jgi:hypothetical protein
VDLIFGHGGLGREMRKFNADQYYFKTDQHGRKLFFPWGVFGMYFGRGYVLTDEDQQRLRRELRIYGEVCSVYLMIAFNGHCSTSHFVHWMALSLHGLGEALAPS